MDRLLVGYDAKAFYMRLRLVPLEILWSPPSFSLVLGLVALGRHWGALFYLGRYEDGWHYDALYLYRIYERLWGMLSR